MADVRWIKITTDIFDDEKIKIIDTMPARDEVLVIWFKLLSLTGKVNQGGLLFFNDRLPYTPEMLAAVFNREVATVKLALQTFETFGMISIEDNEVIGITNWEKHQNIDGMDKIREQNRIRQQRHREEKKKLLPDSNVTDNVTSQPSNGTDKTRKEKNKDIDDFFEECWELYPKKEGKGSVSDKKKKELFALGDEFKRCIERYSQAKKGTEKQFLKMGSTFFNSGYVDYLDENTEQPAPTEPRKPIEIVEVYLE